jgi:acyl dehydratase/uncharacterized protein (DUF1330 family)
MSSTSRPETDRDFWFEDFAPGRSWRTEGATLTEAQILDFALALRPPALPPRRARRRRTAPIGGLIASGFQTISLIFRLWHATSAIANPSGSGSPGMDELRWHAPVRPGDTLHAVVTVLDARPSKSRPRFGLVTWRYEGFNQRGELIISGPLRRPAPPPARKPPAETLNGEPERLMPAYVVVRATVSDPEPTRPTRPPPRPPSPQAGGRYLVRGGETTTVEGQGDPRRLVILEFPDRAAAEAWYAGPAYTHARRLREGIAQMDAQIVDGV